MSMEESNADQSEENESMALRCSMVFKGFWSSMEVICMNKDHGLRLNEEMANIVLVLLGCSFILTL